MSGWPIKKNDASGDYILFPIYDADGDLVTAAASLDSEISKDKGTFTDCTNEATELATSSGVYSLDLTQSELNADRIAVITKTSSSGAKTAVNVIYTESQQIGDLATSSALSTHDGKLDTVDGIVDNILVDTAEIGAAGAGLTAVPWNANWDAQVESECTDALNAYDPPTKTEMDTAHALLATSAALTTHDGKLDTVDTVVDGIQSDLDNATDGLGALKALIDTVDGVVDNILADTGTDGVVLKAAGLDADAANEIADAVLKRDIDQVEASAPVHSLTGAILKAVSKVEDDAGTLKVYQTNGSTLFMSQTITTDSGLDPIDALAVAT